MVGYRRSARRLSGLYDITAAAIRLLLFDPHGRVFLSLFSGSEAARAGAAAGGGRRRGAAGGEGFCRWRQAKRYVGEKYIVIHVQGNFAVWDVQYAASHWPNI